MRVMHVLWHVQEEQQELQRQAAAEPQLPVYSPAPLISLPPSHQMHWAELGKLYCTSVTAVMQQVPVLRPSSFKPIAGYIAITA